MTPAEAYEKWRLPPRLAEPLTIHSPAKLPEMELQARWFAGRFPRRLTTTTGENVEIIHLGVWNREPGPDFCEAVVRIGDNPPKRGSIELDTQLRDWENHGHSINPAFNDVVLHLFVEPTKEAFFTRTERNQFVPQVKLNLIDEEQLAAHPPLAIQGRCSAPLATLPEDIRTNLIEAAAHFRLQKKGQAFARLAASYDWDVALFQSLAITLGYKENKLPFELLAQRLSLQTLRNEPSNIDSLLFGCAGFLDATSLHEFTPDTQVYLRSLWERWWAIRIRQERFILPRSAWKLTGTRPANHPQRRLAALGLIATKWELIAETFRDPSLPKLQKILGNLEHSYWSYHYTITSRRADSHLAILGRSRIIEMLVNVAIPSSLASQPEIWRSLAKINQPLENRKLKTGMLRLFGDSHKTMTNSVLLQQGVLQIYEDYCLRDLTDCSRCPFPEKVLQWEKI